MQVVYEAEATLQGGREGHGRTSDGTIDVDLTPPGSGQDGTNPEQLFAVGYGACFQGALHFMARRAKKDASNSTVNAKVDLGRNDDKTMDIAVKLDISVPGMEREELTELVHLAHEYCPYSRATRGNIGVELLVEGEPI